MRHIPVAIDRRRASSTLLLRLGDCSPGYSDIEDRLELEELAEVRRNEDDSRLGLEESAEDKRANGVCPLSREGAALGKRSKDSDVSEGNGDW